MYKNSSAQLSEVTFHLTEHPRPNVLVGNVFQIVQPTEHVRTLRLEAVETIWLKWFRLDRQTGNLFTTGEASLGLDREKICTPLPLFQPTSKPSACGINLLASINNKQLVKINIILLDVNDNAPVFPQPGPSSTMQQLEIDETSEPGQTKLYLTGAYDPDNGGQQSVFYHLDPPSDYFHLLVEDDPTSGRNDLYLLLDKKLDFETISEFDFNLTACDGKREWPSVTNSVLGESVHCTSLPIHINVRNINDEHPVFKQRNYSVVLKETTPINYPIITVHAYDADMPPHNKIYYHLLQDKRTQEIFELDMDTGVINLRKALPSPGWYRLNVLATNEQPTPSVESNMKQPGSGGASQATVFIHVIDTNNHAPSISLQTSEETDPYLFTIPIAHFDQWTNNTSNTVFLQIAETILVPVTLAYFSVTDRDAGENARVTCNLNLSDSKVQQSTVPNIPFEFNLVSKLTDTRSLYRLVLKASLDAEELVKRKPNHSLTAVDKSHRLATFIDFRIECSDQGIPKMTGDISIVLAVKDIDEFPPELVVTASVGVSSSSLRNYSDNSMFLDFSILENLSPATVVLTLGVIDKDVISLARFKMTEKQAEYLDVNETSGQVYVKVPYDYEAKTFDFVQITVYEVGSHSDSTCVTVTLNIQVADANDHAPVFTAPALASSGVSFSPTYSQNFKFDGIRIIEVREEQPVNESIVQVQAIDSDSNENGQMCFFLVEVLPSMYNLEHSSQIHYSTHNSTHVVELFIDNDGKLWTKLHLDREITSMIDVLVGVHDLGEPRLTSYTSVRIILMDVNDHSPQWQFPTATDYLIIVRKADTLLNQTLTRIHATDLDDPKHNGRLTYELWSQGNYHSNQTPTNNNSDLALARLITQKLIDVHPQTGVIKLRQSLNNLPVGFLDVWLKVTDNGKPARQAVAKLVIYLAGEGNTYSEDALLKLYERPESWIVTKLRSTSYMAALNKEAIQRGGNSQPLFAGGIACGALLVLCFILISVVFLLKRRHQNRKNKESTFPIKNNRSSVQLEPNSCYSVMTPTTALNVKHGRSDSITMLPHSGIELQTINEPVSFPSDSEADYAGPNRNPLQLPVNYVTNYSSGIVHYHTSSSHANLLQTTLTRTPETSADESEQVDYIPASSIIEFSKPIPVKLVTLSPTNYPMAACLTNIQMDTNTATYMKLGDAFTSIVPVCHVQPDFIPSSRFHRLQSPSAILSGVPLKEFSTKELKYNCSGEDRTV